MEGPSLATDIIPVTSIANGTGRLDVQQPSLPAVTSSTSEEYRQRLADIASRATVSDPLYTLFEQDKDPSVTALTPEMMHKTSVARIDRKVGAGAIIVEAANFAAVACWEPPAATPPLFTDEELNEIETQRPVFAQFVRDIQSARLECLGPEQKFWGLSLMVRDPERRDKGAVRAVIETYINKAKHEGSPLWLTASNRRAKEVYEYFGFRVVKVISSYSKDRKLGDEAVSSWSMVCNWPPE